MDKRTFIKLCAVSVGGMISYPSIARTNSIKRVFAGRSTRIFQLPELPYKYDALEPFIDARTMQLHYEKHHAGYVKKLNETVINEEIPRGSAFKLLSEVSKYSENVRNYAGGFFNHKLFWKCLSPTGGGIPNGELLTALEQNFGSFENFKIQFTHSAQSAFNSGWTWLIYQNGKLIVTNTSNQDNPIMDIADVRGFPIMLLDTSDHAYCLKYQNRRMEYIEAYWNIVNWEFVANRFQNHLKRQLIKYS